jgi:hypothetical protein
MDSHQAYCRNFIDLARCFHMGRLAAWLAWLFSSLSITLTVGCAWLIGEVVASRHIDTQGFKYLEYWVAALAIALNFLRYFRFYFFPSKAQNWVVPVQRPDRSRAAFAVGALLGPLLLITLSFVGIPKT